MTNGDAALGSDGGDAAMMTVGDGTPTRQTCTSDFGDALSAQPTFGRLDGFLVAIVPPANMQSCNDDDSHVHLQVRMSGMIYDVAIDVTDETTMMDDVHTTPLDIAMPDAMPWTEGWHTGTTVLADYVALGLHDTDLTLEAKADLVQLLRSRVRQPRERLHHELRQRWRAPRASQRERPRRHPGHRAVVDTIPPAVLQLHGPVVLTTQV
jgi:hypothetical protein